MKMPTRSVYAARCDVMPALVDRQGSQIAGELRQTHVGEELRRIPIMSALHRTMSELASGTIADADLQ